MHKKINLIAQGLAISAFMAGILAVDSASLLAQTSNIPFDVEQEFVPCGWMGDGEDKDANFVKMAIDFVDNSRDGDVIQVVYHQGGPKKWAGVYWLLPDGEDCNWGRFPGIEIIGATKVTFWARSEQGSERIEFKAGGVRGGPQEDNFMTSAHIDLTTQWKQYEIDLSSKNFERVIGAFAWIARRPDADGVVFYLDDIRYE